MTTATVDRARIKELRTALETKVAEAEGLAADWKVETTDDGKTAFVVSPEKHAMYVKAVKDGEEIKALLDSAESAGRLRGYLDAPDVPPTGGAVNAADARNAVVGMKALGDYFTDSEVYQQQKSRGWGDAPFFRVEIDKANLTKMQAAARAKDIFNLSAGEQTFQALGTPQVLPMITLPRRQVHIRDLFPRATTTAPVLYGIRETGWVNNAAIVKQRMASDEVSPATGGPTDVFGKKPRSQITLAPVMYPVATIAHLIDAHRSILDDEPRLQLFLNTRMTDGLFYAEDYELLYGVGGAEAITGIYNTPGIQSYNVSPTTDKYSVQIRRAATRAMLAEYEPTGVVINPLDWEAVEVETDNTGAFRVAIAVAVGAEKRLWRLNVVDTTAHPEGRYLLGAFGLGAQYYDRETAAVIVSTENRDNVERNVVTIRAEERGALEVARPESFVAGTFVTPS